MKISTEELENLGFYQYKNQENFDDWFFDGDKDDYCYNIKTKKLSVVNEINDNRQFLKIVKDIDDLEKTLEALEY